MQESCQLTQLSYKCPTSRGQRATLTRAGAMQLCQRPHSCMPLGVTCHCDTWPGPGATLARMQSLGHATLAREQLRWRGPLGVPEGVRGRASSSAWFGRTSDAGLGNGSHPGGVPEDLKQIGGRIDFKTGNTHVGWCVNRLIRTTGWRRQRSGGARHGYASKGPRTGKVWPPSRPALVGG